MHICICILIILGLATPPFPINAQYQHHTWVRWATGKKSVLHPFPHVVLLLPVRKPPTVLRSCTVYYTRDIVFPLPGLGSSLAKSDSERSTRSRNRGKGRRGRGRGERDWGSRSYDDEPEERSECLKSAYAKCADQENGHSISSQEWTMAWSRIYVLVKLSHWNEYGTLILQVFSTTSHAVASCL